MPDALGPPPRDGQTADLDWSGETPVSRRYGDPYYSRTDGLGETRHTFLGGNDLPARFRPGFRIAELGFGTGLNVLAAWEAWDEAGQAGPLAFTSFEAHPLAPAEMDRALGAFASLAARAGALIAACRADARPVRLPGLILDIRLGDAATTLPAWDGAADAWFLDGFAPARNPGLWTPAILEAVARHTAPRGTVATYTAAGHVRRALATAGFTVRRVRGHGRKRHMTRACLPSTHPTEAQSDAPPAP